MKVEIKKITYTPDQRDDDGGLKKEAFFALQMHVPNTEELKEMLVDIMLLGDAEVNMELSPASAQGLMTEVREQVKEMTDLGLTEVKRG